MNPVGTNPRTTTCGDLEVDDRLELRMGHTNTYVPVRVLFIERYPVAGRVRITFVSAGGTRIARTRYAHEPLSTIARVDQAAKYIRIAA